METWGIKDGFSILHCIAYSIILIQQLNLAYHYPSIYWNTAVLLVNSGAVDMEQDNQGEESYQDKKEKTTNYGEVASAIGNLQSRGIKIDLPNINTADQGFLPNEQKNSIVFGLKGIMAVNNETAQIIINNRPYSSLQDFHNKLVETKREVTLSTGKKQMKSYVTTGQTITLIKAGAFDSIENKTREEILENYLKFLNPSKKKLNTKDISKLSEFGVISNDMKEVMRYYNFRAFILTLEKIQDENSKTVKWYKLKCDSDEITEYTENFFLERFAVDMEEDRDYIYNDDGIIEVAIGRKRKGSFDNVYSDRIKELTNWLGTQECLDTYNRIMFETIKRENMSGTISTWEMEAMNYYYHEHELAHVDAGKYGVVNYNNLSSDPIIVGYTKYNDMKYPKFKLDRIMGTVLDRDKSKHTVTLLTPTGVVKVKFYAGQFSFYDKTISKIIIDEKGKEKKITLEKGFFQRGTLLLVTGFRRGDVFTSKRYNNSIYQHSVAKITKVHENGTLDLQLERFQDED